MTSESSWVPLLSLAALFAFLLALGADSPDDVIMLTIVMVVAFVTWVGTRSGSRPTPTTAPLAWVRASP